MTPKQKYDERKRLRIENDLRAEQRRAAGFDREEEMEERFNRILKAMERIADVMELWADKQVSVALETTPLPDEALQRYARMAQERGLRTD